jgi:hypothetical protein
MVCQIPVKDGVKMHRKSSLCNRLTWYVLSLETGIYIFLPVSFSSVRILFSDMCLFLRVNHFLFCNLK